MGCEALSTKPLLWSAGTQNPGSFQAEGTNKSAKNNHPTVKPLKLMEYLVKLVARPGAIVLDPFGGSFTTAIACANLDRRCLIVEQNAEYMEIGIARLTAALKKMATRKQLQP